jgi:dihydropteroate synthase
MLWHLRTTSLDCTRPQLVGILNVTPDSFAAVGRELDAFHAADHAQTLIRDGASMLDVGAESTRPGAASVSDDEQIARLRPVLTELRDRGVLATCPVSVDTTSSAVALTALALGAQCVNDVSGGTADPRMLRVIAEQQCGFIIMHRMLAPSADHYSDRMPAPLLAGNGVDGVCDALARLRDDAVRAGVQAARIALDPGLGFGKTVEQNLALIAATPRIAALGHVVMSALSRKSFVGRVGLGRDSTPEERLPATLAFSLHHARVGARLLRVHDVAAHAAALRVEATFEQQQTPPPLNP